MNGALAELGGGHVPVLATRHGVADAGGFELSQHGGKAGVVTHGLRIETLIAPASDSAGAFER
jgi:hypothetical protein